MSSLKRALAQPVSTPTPAAVASTFSAGSTPSAPTLTGTGQRAETNVIYARKFLQSKDKPQTIGDIILHLSLQNYPAEHQKELKRLLMLDGKVNYDAKTETFTFRPLHNIRNADQLLAHLQAQKNAKGLSVKELKDGWPDAETAINDLEDRNLLLVIRNKKNKDPRMVWPNDPSLVAPIDEEFKTLWEKIELPDAEHVLKTLEEKGLTPAGRSNMTVKKAVKVEKKKKKRRTGKVTNDHMMPVLKDYSYMKK